MNIVPSQSSTDSTDPLLGAAAAASTGVAPSGSQSDANPSTALPNAEVGGTSGMGDVASGSGSIMRIARNTRAAGTQPGHWQMGGDGIGSGSGNVVLVFDQIPENDSTAATALFPPPITAPPATGHHQHPGPTQAIFNAPLEQDTATILDPTPPPSPIPHDTQPVPDPSGGWLYPHAYQLTRPLSPPSLNPSTPGAEVDIPSPTDMNQGSARPLPPPDPPPLGRTLQTPYDPRPGVNAIQLPQPPAPAAEPIRNGYWLAEVGGIVLPGHVPTAVQVNPDAPPEDAAIPQPVHQPAPAGAPNPEPPAPNDDDGHSTDTDDVDGPEY